jgi:hypothetical protein
MEKSNLIMPNRRDFITKVFPACSLMCFGKMKVLTGICSAGETSIIQEAHMFDREFTRKLTHRQWVQSINRNFIEFAQAVKQEFGKEQTIELIKKLATEFNLKRGQKQAQNSKDRSLKTYTRMFADPKRWEPMLKMEVVEDTETAFELKVAECIWATVFRDAKAADIGYAHVCWGDYAWAEGFNPKIKLIRDKTLMQGDTFCNHRYIFEG